MTNGNRRRSARSLPLAKWLQWDPQPVARTESPGCQTVVAATSGRQGSVWRFLL